MAIRRRKFLVGSRLSAPPKVSIFQPNSIVLGEMYTAWYTEKCSSHVRTYVYRSTHAGGAARPRVVVWRGAYNFRGRVHFQGLSLYLGWVVCAPCIDIASMNANQSFSTWAQKMKTFSSLMPFNTGLSLARIASGSSECFIITSPGRNLLLSLSFVFVVYENHSLALEQTSWRRLHSCRPAVSHPELTSHENFHIRCNVRHSNVYRPCLREFSGVSYNRELSRISLACMDITNEEIVSFIWKMENHQLNNHHPARSDACS